MIFCDEGYGEANNFLGIEVVYQKHDLLLSQRKYTLDLLKEIGMLECKPAGTPMEVNVDLWYDNVIYLMTLDSIGD